MRVLQINSTCGVGSTGKIAVDIYKALENQGDECLIAFGRGKAPKGVCSYKIGNDFSVKLHGILSRLTDRHGFYSFFPTKRLVNQIKKYNPDIIHLHNIHGYYLNLSVLFKYLSWNCKGSEDNLILYTLNLPFLVKVERYSPRLHLRLTVS